VFALTNRQTHPNIQKEILITIPPIRYRYANGKQKLYKIKKTKMPSSIEIKQVL